MIWPTQCPLVAILRGLTPNDAIEHIGALIEAGFDAIEIPLNSPDWQNSIALAVHTFGDQAMIGAGTVLNTNEVDTLHDIGARFIVTPNTDAEVIARARQHDLFTSIGCMTATEAFTALKAGAQSLKFFPAGTLGADYIKALTAVLPKDIPLLAVGGVRADNLSTFLDAGCTGAGLGSDLYRPAQTIETTRQNAKAFINAYHSWIS